MSDLSVITVLLILAISAYAVTLVNVCVCACAQGSYISYQYTHHKVTEWKALKLTDLSYELEARSENE